MSQTERLYRLKAYLDAGRCLTKALLLEEFEISPATLKRDLAHLRDRMNAPLVFDRELGGWRLDQDAVAMGPKYELPGLWFSADEIHALLTMQQLVAGLDAGGLLRSHIDPLMDRLKQLVGSGESTHAEIARRIRVTRMSARRIHIPHFQTAASALLTRRRLWIEHHVRGRGESRERDVSPQRLVHYRDNWYLDAWCHLRDGLRSFALDAISAARMLDHAAIDVDDSELDAMLGAGYGIFAGREVKWATLRFSAERARWVSAESWHPSQEGVFEADGSYLLRVPYADSRELVMDILRHVPEVQVAGPAELRDTVLEKLRLGAVRA